VSAIRRSSAGAGSHQPGLIYGTNVVYRRFWARPTLTAPTAGTGLDAASGRECDRNQIVLGTVAKVQATVSEGQPFNWSVGATTVTVCRVRMVSGQIPVGQLNVSEPEFPLTSHLELQGAATEFLGNPGPSA
jgi:hypothetical protein